MTSSTTILGADSVSSRLRHLQLHAAIRVGITQTAGGRANEAILESDDNKVVWVNNLLVTEGEAKGTVYSCWYQGIRTDKSEAMRSILENSKALHENPIHAGLFATVLVDHYLEQMDRNRKLLFRVGTAGLLASSLIFTGPIGSAGLIAMFSSAGGMLGTLAADVTDPANMSSKMQNLAAQLKTNQMILESENFLDTPEQSSQKVQSRVNTELLKTINEFKEKSNTPGAFKQILDQFEGMLTFNPVASLDLAKLASQASTGVAPIVFLGTPSLEARAADGSESWKIQDSPGCLAPSVILPVVMPAAI